MSEEKKAVHYTRWNTLYCIMKFSWYTRKEHLTCLAIDVEERKKNERKKNERAKWWTEPKHKVIGLVIPKLMYIHTATKKRRCEKFILWKSRNCKLMFGEIIMKKKKKKIKCIKYLDKHKHTHDTTKLSAQKQCEAKWQTNKKKWLSADHPLTDKHSVRAYHRQPECDSN